MAAPAATPARSWWRVGGALGLALVLGACATPQRPDPLEPWNRKVYAFNDAVDVAVLRPVATVYRDRVPEPVRTATTHFFANIQDAWSAVNLVLQGRPADGLSDVLRFGTNTVFGVLGLFDVATPLGLERHGEDFGQTLGKWGLPQGPYFVLPFLGPSTVRDTAGFVVDRQASPSQLLHVDADRYALLTRINQAYEKAIRAYPEQWLWGHQRWKTRPPGEVSGSDGLPPRAQA